MTLSPYEPLIRSKGKFSNFVTRELAGVILFFIICLWVDRTESQSLSIPSNGNDTSGSRSGVGMRMTASSYLVYRNDPFALLSGTLRTYQKAACDDEWLSLRCPISTTLSIQLAQYGKVATSPALCSSTSGTHPDLMDDSHNVTCLWPTAIQPRCVDCSYRVTGAWLRIYEPLKRVLKYLLRGNTSQIHQMGDEIHVGIGSWLEFLSKAMKMEPVEDSGPIQSCGFV